MTEGWLPCFCWTCRCGKVLEQCCCDRSDKPVQGEYPEDWWCLSCRIEAGIAREEPVDREQIELEFKAPTRSLNERLHRRHRAA